MNLASYNAFSLPNHRLAHCSLGAKQTFCSRSKKCLVEFEQEIHIDHKQSIKPNCSPNSIFTLTTNHLFSWFVFREREQQPISLLPHLSLIPNNRQPNITYHFDNIRCVANSTHHDDRLHGNQFFSPAFTPLHNVTPKK